MKIDSIESLERLLEKGRGLHQQGALVAAEEVYCEILKRDPTHFDALNLSGVISGQSGNFQRAIQFFDKAIIVAPGIVSAHCNKGLALKQLKQLDAALTSFNQAIALKGDDALNFYYRANTYKDLGKSAQALADYAKSIALNPAFAPSYFERGTVLQSVEQPEAALASYDRAIELKADYVEAYVNRGFVLHMLNRTEAAVASYEKAIAIRADPVAYLFLGNALKDLNRRDAALNCYEHAIGLKADYAEAYLNQGAAFYEIGAIEKALACYDRALSVKPDYAEALFNRASVLRAVQHFDSAIADFRQAAALKPQLDFLPGALLEAKLQVCDWSGIDENLQHVISGIERGEPTSHPFVFLTFSDDPRLQREAAAIFVRITCPADNSLGAIPKRAAKRKITLGYFSADFREHPVARLLADTIDAHDRSRFEVIALSFGPNTEDPMKKRLEGAFDQFIDVRECSHRDVAILARDMELDIAVDLSGYTQHSRPAIFALRAAPVQISYLGYPGTMGSSYMDYLLADETLISADEQCHYSEKLIYLPSFQSNAHDRPVSKRIFTRKELGLPPEAFVFCCFNSSYKIRPFTFASWMRILSRVSGSVLFLDAKTETIKKNLREEAITRGVEPNRLVFGGALTLPDWLARHCVADLFLDTLPYTAGTTASDALWTGLPVLTLLGSSFAGRMAASLLRAIDLRELITRTESQYEDLAVELARNPERLANIKQRLAHNRMTKPLFDTTLFTRNLEAAYVSVHERQLAGLAPDHIRI